MSRTGPFANRPKAMPKRPLILFALAAVLVLAAIAWTWHSRTPDLLAKSRKVLKLSTIWQSTGAPLDGCFWQSDRVVLAHDNVGDGFFSSAFLLDIRTGRRTELPKVTKAFWIHDSGVKAYEWSLSPNRQWLLWVAGWLGARDVVACRVDGSEVQTWPATYIGDDYSWLKQPGTFVRFAWNRKGELGEAYEYMLGKPKPTRHIVFRGFVAGSSCLGLLADGRVLTLDDVAPAYPALAKLIAISLDRPIPSATVHAIPAPDHGAFKDVQLSPDGKRLAWVVENERSLSNNGILACLERLIGMRDHDTLSLWTSDTNGDNMREIGARPRKDEYDEAYLKGWLPDDRHIAYKDGGEFGWLYIVPTD